MPVSETTEKVIYQYTLLKKIRNHPSIQAAFIILLLLFGGMLHVLGYSQGWFWLVGSIIGWQCIYYGLTLSFLAHESGSYAYREKYHFLFRLPWFGFLPDSGVPFRQYRSLQFHLFFVCLLLAASLSVWLPLYAAAAVGFAHIWSMLPRFFVVAGMHRANRSSSIVAFSHNDVSLHAP